jgi:hypothetical protein
MINQTPKELLLPSSQLAVAQLQDDNLLQVINNTHDNPNKSKFSKNYMIIDHVVHFVQRENQPCIRVL